MFAVKKQVLWPLFGLVVAVGLIHHNAVTHHWYWSYWWMDVLVHCLGGATIGMGALWLLSALGWELDLPRVFLIVVGVTLVVGVGWELFETAAGYFKFERQFPDTFFDLFSDLAGGMSAYVYAVLARLIFKSDV